MSDLLDPAVWAQQAFVKRWDISPTDAFARAAGAHVDAELLEDLLRLPSAGLASDATRAELAERLLELEPDSVVAARAAVVTHGLDDVVEQQRRWQRLERSARAAGELGMAAAARHWARGLVLPWPSLPVEVDPIDWVAAAVESLEDVGCTVVARPDPLEHNGAVLPVSLEVRDFNGGQWLVVLQRGSTAEPDLELRLGATVRALANDERRHAAQLLWFAPGPQPLRPLRWCTRTPDAMFDVDADADTTMKITGENAAALIDAARELLGVELEARWDGLGELDRVLDVLHDHGFGGATWATRCRIASLLGEAVAATHGGQWVWPDRWRPVYRVESKTIDLFALIDLRLVAGRAVSVAGVLSEGLGVRVPREPSQWLS